jgi:hypothetical protein
MSALGALSASTFETSEYWGGGGLDLIHASDAYAKGYTGNNVLVAVMDSGIAANHEKFKYKLYPGYDMITGKSVRTDDSDGHGTHVSGIIAARKTGKNMHGVAYNANLLPIRILNGEENENNSFDKNLSSAIRHSIKKGARINNNSWGYVDFSDDGYTYYSTPLGDITREDIENEYPFQIAAFQEATLIHDQIFVFAAGNIQNTTQHQENPGVMGMFPIEFPEFKGHWLTVVNVDQTGLIHDSSHHCGEAASWCLAAPGVDILSTVPNGQYAYYTGTSMATPHVSGGLALLAEAFPNLSGEKLVRRLLKTADKTGHFSDASIYGQGLLQLDQATKPIGRIRYPKSSSVEGETELFQGTIQDSPLLSFASLFDQKTVLVLDSFDLAPFQASLDTLSEKPTQTSPLAQWVAPLHTGYATQALHTLSVHTSENTLHSVHWTHQKIPFYWHYEAEPPHAHFQETFLPYAPKGQFSHTIGYQAENVPLTWQISQTTLSQPLNPGATVAYQLLSTQPRKITLKTGVFLENQQLFGLTSNHPLLGLLQTPTFWQGFQIQKSKEHLSGIFDLHYGQSAVKTALNSTIQFPKTLHSYAWQATLQQDSGKHQWRLWMQKPITFIALPIRAFWPVSVNADGSVNINVEDRLLDLPSIPHWIGASHTYTWTQALSTHLQGEKQWGTKVGYWVGVKTRYTF